MTDEQTNRSAFVLVSVVAVVFAVALASTAVVADTPPEPDLQCIGSGGGVPYTTDSGFTVYENHTADINQFFFPSFDTVRFDYSTGAVDISAASSEVDLIEPELVAEQPMARLESVTEDGVCLGSVDGLVYVQPDNGVGLVLDGFSVDVSYRDPVFDSSDEGVDLIYNASQLYMIELNETGLDEGQTVWMYNDSGIELGNTTVSDGFVTFDSLSLPEEGLHQLDFVADVDQENDENDDQEEDTTSGGSGSSGSGSGSSGSSGSSDDEADNEVDADDDSETETEREVTEVTAVDSEPESESDDEDEETADDSDVSDVRSSSVRTSVSGGSTLAISLGLDDVDFDDPDETDETDETDEPDETDESDDATEEDPTELEDTDEEAVEEDSEDDADTEDEADDDTDADADADEPVVADSDIGERPPPTSQAEVESIEIDVNQDADVDIEIRQSRSPPSADAREFERADGTQAAGYIQINNNLDPEAVDGGRISYRLSKADLAIDDADPENVAMYYFNTDTEEWDELPTEVVGETDSHVRFRADTPGFSQFASGIKRAQFEISDAIVDVQEVTLGETVRVEAIITNTGGADGTFRTELVVDDEVVEDDILTIAAGGTRATLFDHEFIQPDTYEVRVNDVSTGVITVIAPASITSDETESFIPGFGVGVAIVSLLVASLAARRQQTS